MTFIPPPPQTGDYGDFYEGYVARVREHPDVLALLEEQPAFIRSLAALGEVEAATPPTPGEWSAKQILGHLCDFERVFAYRALRISRGDTTPIEGFEQDAYVAAGNANDRPLTELIAEFVALRTTTVTLYRSLTPSMFEQHGTASGMGVTVAALCYITAGHAEGHFADLRRDYPVPGQVTFASSEVAQFWSYISGSLSRLMELIETEPAEVLRYRPPAEGANSVLGMARHALANAADNILSVLGSAATVRDRETEFEEMDPADLVVTWRTLEVELRAVLAAIPAGALDATVQHGRRGTIAQREVLIIVARHAAEHLGQAELTRDLAAHSQLATRNS